IPIQVHSEADIENVIRKVANEPNSGLFVLPDSHNIVHRKRIIELTAQYRYRQFTIFAISRLTAVLSPMAPMKWTSSGALRVTWIKFSRVRARQIFRSSSQRNSS